MPAISSPRDSGNMPSSGSPRPTRSAANTKNPIVIPIARTWNVGAGAAYTAKLGHTAHRKIELEPTVVAVAEFVAGSFGKSGPILSANKIVEVTDTS